MDQRYYVKLQKDGRTEAELYFIHGGCYQFYWHSELEIMLVLKGGGEVYVEGKRYLLEQFDMLAINSNSGHALFIRDMESIILVFQVTPEFFRQHFQCDIWETHLDCISHKTVRRQPLFMQLRFLAARAFDSGLRGQERLAESYLTTLMLELMQNFSSKNILRKKQREGAGRDTLAKALDFIEVHFDEKLTLEQVAAQVRYNRTYLSTLFKKLIGLSFNDYIIRVRLRHVLERLADTQASITEIALDCGFPDGKTMLSSFKKYFGYTPQEYRSVLMENPEMEFPNEENKYLTCPNKEAERILKLLQDECFGFPEADSKTPGKEEIEACADELRRIADRLSKI